MVYFIWISLGCLSFLFKRNKYITTLVFIFIAVIFCFNTANADLNNYIAKFNGINLNITEPLYNLLGDCFYNAGASYEIYRAFLSLSSLGLITWTFCKLTPYPTLALFMYSIYPLTLDVTQIRFTVAYSIVFFGIYFLLKYQNERKNKYIIIFYILIAVATGFHYSCILFAVLGLTVLDIAKHRLLYLVIIPLALIAGITMLDKAASLITSVIGLGKANRWVLERRDLSIIRLIKILTVRGLPMAFSFVLAFVAKNQRYKSICRCTESIGLINLNTDKIYLPESDPHKYYSIKYNRCMFLCIFYIWVFSILEITIAGTYERIARLGVLIGSALITRQLFYLKKPDRQIMIFLYLCMFIVYFLTIMLFNGNKLGQIYIDYVFRQVMESNIIFGITYP